MQIIQFTLFNQKHQYQQERELEHRRGQRQLIEFNQRHLAPNLFIFESYSPLLWFQILQSQAQIQFHSLEISSPHLPVRDRASQPLPCSVSLPCSIARFNPVPTQQTEATAKPGRASIPREDMVNYSSFFQGKMPEPCPQGNFLQDWVITLFSLYGWAPGSQGNK